MKNKITDVYIHLYLLLFSLTVLTILAPTLAHSSNESSYKLGYKVAACADRYASGFVHWCVENIADYSKQVRADAIPHMLTKLLPQQVSLNNTANNESKGCGELVTCISNFSQVIKP